MILVRTLLIGMVCIFVAVTVTAQSTSPPPVTDEDGRPYFIGEVVVSEREDAPSPSGAVDSLEASEIRALGVDTVAEALRFLPGVTVTTGARNEQVLKVRGYEQHNVLVLVDGVPISDSYYGYADLGQLPVRDVARITVTRGAASPIYGPNALGGVINISTFQGSGTGGVSGELRLANNDEVLLHAASGGTYGSMNWYVGAEYLSTDGFPLSGDFESTEYEDGGTRVNSDRRRTSLMARLGWQLDDASSLFASVRWTDAEKGIPFHTESPTGFLKFSRFSDWQQGTLTLGYQRAWTGGEIRAQFFSHLYDNVLEVYQDPELDSLRLESTFEDRVFGGFVVSGWKLDKKQWLDLSLHMRRDVHTAFEDYPEGERSGEEQYESDLASLAAQDQINFGKRWSAVAAISFERYGMRQVGSPEGDTGADAINRSQNSTSPQVEIRYQVSPKVLTTAALYRRTGFPTLRQVFSSQASNPDLKPQTATGAGLGFEFPVSTSIVLSADLFSDRVKDMISRSSRSSPYENLDEAEIRGLELGADGRLKKLSWGLGLTFNDAEFVESTEGFREVPLVPRTAADARLQAPLGRRFEIRGNWLFVGQRVVYDRGLRTELDPYSVFRVGGSYHLGSFEFLADLDNILDADYEPEPGYPASGRRLWLGVRFRIR